MNESHIVDLLKSTGCLIEGQIGEDGGDRVDRGRDGAAR